VIAYELALRLPQLDNNAYRWHQFLWKQLAPRTHVEHVPSFLYRTLAASGETFALLRLPEELAQRLPQKMSWRKIDCPFDAHNQRIVLSVRLCPLYRTQRNRERTPPDMREWCAALFARHGFALRSIAVGALEKNFYAKPGQREIAHNTRIFSAVADVIHLERAQHAWLCGIGRRKNTGCGLLLEESESSKDNESLEENHA
jgi:hypothetical protein